MAKYLQTAGELRELVEKFVKENSIPHEQVAQLGYIINLAVRCAPRAVQGTVRKNIVDTAVGEHCNVSMTKVQADGYSYNKISITPRVTSNQGE